MELPMSKLPRTLMPFFWHFIKKQPIPFTIFFLAPTLVVIETAFLPYLLKIIIDAFSVPNADRAATIEQITPLLWLGGGSWLFFVSALRLQHYWQSKVIPKFEADIRMSVMEYITAHSYNYFSNQLAGTLSNKISDLPRALSTIRMIICWNVIATFSAVSASLIMLATVKPIFSVILAVWIFFHLLGAYYLAQVVNRNSEINAEDKSTLSGCITDTLSNMNAVKLFARRTFEKSYIGKKQEIERLSNKRMIKSMSSLMLCMDITITLMLGAIIYFLVHGWKQQILSTGDIIFVFNVCWMVTFHMWMLGNALIELFREVGVANQALSVIITPHEITDSKDAPSLQVIKGEIAFKDVTFCYRKNNNIFNNKNVTLKAGERVGLVGFSGSGKTTFVNLIMRFFDVSSGKILIDDQEITEVTQDSLHESITMIPQDPSLFHRSLMDNIRYSKPTASDEEVIEASKRAHCHDFIAKLEQGYDTLVGERGIKLSGGQRQRIAIARAFLKNAPILILDEATSALDSMTEKYIQEAFRELMEGKTTLIIAHRLSTLSQVDRILVFDNGHIVEDGTHDSLLKNESGHYFKLWQMQAGGFLPEKEEN